jgi:hypothetical protein
MTLFGLAQTSFSSDDYYTPKHLFETMNVSFDLDVCHPPFCTAVPCARYLTTQDDGLTSPWSGSVWMNPPFSRPEPWVRRFMEHANGIALLPVSKSRWFSQLWNSKAALTSLPSNLKFVDPQGGNGSIFIPACLAAFGDVNVAAIGRVGRVR